jgi:hypothetical protein
MNASIKGASKSVTIYAALIILILSNVAPLVPVLLAQLGLHAQTIQAVGTFGAIVMTICRVITTTSLADKGADAVVDAAAAVPAAPAPVTPPTTTEVKP